LTLICLPLAAISVETHDSTGMQNTSINNMSCNDGTLYNSCSVNKPFFCLGGALMANCSLCGCAAGRECNRTTGYCHEIIYRCNDSTAYGTCSSQKPLFCTEGKLVDKCALCGCGSGQCASDGKCYTNNAPVIFPIGNREIDENKTLEFRVEASDPDGDFIAFFVSGLPPGASFNATNGVFIWTPNFNQTGNYWVTFYVVDQGYPRLGVQEMIRITVGEANRPPEIMPIPDLSSDENVLIEFYVRGSDPDSDPIWYYAQGLPYGTAFNKTTGKFSWNPAFNQGGNYPIRFTVSDGHYNISRNITITIGNINRPPVAAINYPIAGWQFYAGIAISFSAAGSSDPDGGTLVYSWNFGDGETYSGTNATVDHVYKNPGGFEATLVVSDGFLQNEKTVNILVNEVAAKDSDNDGVEDSQDRCPGTELMVPVNEYGCQPPKYTEFENNQTTDLSVIDITNATKIVLVVPGKVMIEFRRNEINLAGINLDKFIDVGENNVTIKTAIAPELNRSAVLTFYNVSMDNPIIARDGDYCDDCKILAFENRTLTFSVPHFTTYSLLSYLSFSGYCGDKLCSIYESCSACPEDCSKCGAIDTKPPGACEEMWACSGWSECNELDIRTRECNDINLCGSRDRKPAEAMECGKGVSDYTSFILFGSIVAILVFFYLVSETYKKRKQDVSFNEFEMEKTIKGYMYRGYSSEEITKMLLGKGYTKSDIEEVLKKTQKEIF
ncbi:MAG: PKD domain-containing protein, partial [Candidatus Aenigmatarchaeota archaeon]